MSKNSHADGTPASLGVGLCSRHTATPGAALYEASIALEHEGGQTIDPEVFNKLLGLPPPSSTSNRGKVKQGKVQAALSLHHCQKAQQEALLDLRKLKDQRFELIEVLPTPVAVISFPCDVCSQSLFNMEGKVSVPPVLQLNMSFSRYAQPEDAVAF
eukprot:1157877-Pelagomonas_calceolata.AAC.4